MPARSRLADLVPKSPGDLDIRGWEWFQLDRVFHPELKILDSPGTSTMAIAMSPDGRTIALGGLQPGSQAPLWIVDSVSGQRLRVLSGHRQTIMALAFSPDGQTLASAGVEGTVQIRDTVTFREKATFRGHLGRVMAVAYAPDSRTLVSGDDGSTIRIWDVVSSQLLGTLGSDQSGILSLAFSPNGRTLASGGMGTIGIWDTVLKKSTKLEAPGGVWSLAFSPDGRKFAGIWEGIKLRIWETASFRDIATIHCQQGGLHRVQFAPDGRRLATGGRDGSIDIWDATSGSELTTLRGPTGLITDMTFSPDGRLVVSAGYHDPKVRIWDTASATESRSSSNPLGSSSGVTFTPDGQTLAAQGSFNSLRIWDVATGRVIGTVRKRRARIGPVWLSASGQGLVAAVGFDGKVRILDLASHRERVTLAGYYHGWGMAFSPDGSRLAACGSESKIRLFESSSGKELATLPGAPRCILAFSPDCRLLAQSNDGIGGASVDAIHIWETASHREMATFSGHKGGVSSLAFSPESRFLASAGRDGYVRIWDTATKQETAALRADRAWVTSIAFAPDGRRLVSGNYDGTVRVWDMATRREAAAFRGLSANLCESLAFAPDGRTLALGRFDSVLIREGGPLSPRQSIDREALGLVRFLLDRATSLPALRERIDHDPSISEEVRAAALLLTGPLWDDHSRAHAEQEAEKLVEALFAPSPLREEVEEALRTRPGLDPQVRAIAIELAGSWYPSKALYEASWEVVRKSGYRPSEYRRALRYAEEASGDSPENPYALFVLGVAQYRNGLYREALSTLGPLTGDRGLIGGDEYPRRAFMALSRFKLGQIDEARRSLEKTLADYRANPQGPAYLFADIPAILREAEVEIELSPGFPADPFAP